MTLANWITVGVAILGGVVLGLIFSSLASRLISKESNPPALIEAAKPVSSLVFSVFMVAGLIVALGVIRPKSVDELINDSVNFIPKLLTAFIILIIANVLSTFAVTAMGPGLSRLPFDVQQKANFGVKALIVTFAVLLAVSHLGINTEIVNLALGSIFFAVAASLALLVGLGGHGVAKQVASTRALKRLVKVGDRIIVDNVHGLVTNLHPTLVEVVDPAGKTILIPSAKILSQMIKIDRVEPT